MATIRRPVSVSDARDDFYKARDQMVTDDPTFKTRCRDTPVLYTDMRWDEEDAARLCGRGTNDECPLLELCEPLGYTESVYADDMVYGGVPWRRGKPVVSETTPDTIAEKRRKRKERYK